MQLPLNEDPGRGNKYKGSEVGALLVCSRKGRVIRSEVRKVSGDYII
jgi:hypothetical protein